MIKSNIPLFWWNVSTRSKRGRFGTLLGLAPEALHPSGTLRVEGVDDNESIVSLQVPRWCCDEVDGRLKLSAGLAMIDEISTYAGVCVWDPRCRPGASIQLAGRAVNEEGNIDVGPRDRIWIRSTNVKVGRTIAFVKANIEGTGGEVLAQCSHIKFMPMGFPLDYGVCAAPIGGIVEAFANRLPLHDQSIPDNVSEVFPLDQNDLSTNASSSMVVTEDHGNPIGSIHGGASLMLTTLAAEKVQPRRTKPSWIKTNLVNGIDCATKQNADIRVDAKMGRVTTGATLWTDEKLCADTVIEWANKS
mmetsp:Transcript_610/g.1866  ORF Transcript_610/g.1866 Transcript_610/m.1866 type:complete len:303 (-) Transcript_610:239-1147(-)|eukprot:CAMPEP_0113575656 /NCGR_PEP_ID=MMETSP0015_2-20120614/27821_1 /TAXON_ID=2838 /ORGANISM="Odontella" /LENGTH=302 /DNA_ID=CAMNT_0000478923 /DNA_START=181 /DNA_END=1089 /DNA_ORIENTATION=+ /assembly_acc=CAM_ASM_000160